MIVVLIECNGILQAQRLAFLLEEKFMEGVLLNFKCMLPGASIAKSCLWSLQRKMV